MTNNNRIKGSTYILSSSLVFRWSGMFIVLHINAVVKRVMWVLNILLALWYYVLYILMRCVCINFIFVDVYRD